MERQGARCSWSLRVCARHLLPLPRPQDGRRCQALSFLPLDGSGIRLSFPSLPRPRCSHMVPAWPVAWILHSPTPLALHRAGRAAHQILCSEHVRPWLKNLSGSPSIPRESPNPSAMAPTRLPRLLCIRPDHTFRPLGFPSCYWGGLKGEVL